ncbi:hypothetical protein ACFYPA_22345 [Streptomyces sp. NPDC005775]|uniref:hypothetical protein n=1 Tax=unclassified Streptomyces TaxID=2593676 RepID=UPI0033C75F89
MHRTRTTAKLLAGVAVTALSGCVSVQPQPSPPAPPESSRPAQHLAPQIVRPPVRDTLEALPDPKPSPSATPAARRDGPRPPQQQRSGQSRPQPRRAGPPASVPVPAVPAPVTGADVCALGRGYGHWPAGSPQSRICDDTYGR